MTALLRRCMCIVTILMAATDLSFIFIKKWSSVDAWKCGIISIEKASPHNWEKFYVRTAPKCHRAKLMASLNTFWCPLHTFNAPRVSLCKKQRSHVNKSSASASLWQQMEEVTRLHNFSIKCPPPKNQEGESLCHICGVRDDITRERVKIKTIINFLCKENLASCQCCASSRSVSKNRWKCANYHHLGTARGSAINEVNFEELK